MIICVTIIVVVAIAAMTTYATVTALRRPTVANLLTNEAGGTRAVRAAHGAPNPPAADGSSRVSGGLFRPLAGGGFEYQEYSPAATPAAAPASPPPGSPAERGWVIVNNNVGAPAPAATGNDDRRQAVVTVPPFTAPDAEPAARRPVRIEPATHREAVAAIQ